MAIGLTHLHDLARKLGAPGLPIPSLDHFFPSLGAGPRAPPAKPKTPAELRAKLRALLPPG